MPRRERADKLTPRQIEVVRLVSLGCSEKEVAAILGIAGATINVHRSAAMKILGARNSVLLAGLAIKHNYSSMDDKLSPKEKRLSGREDDGWNY